MLLSDIGEGSSALFCLTDRTQCCSTTAGGERHGAWRFPNGSEVIQGSMSGDIYYDRSYSSVILNRRNNTVGPTGIYACAIPSEADFLTALYIGVYGSTPGPLTASLSYDRASHTLNCVSSGGPVNTVTWRRNSVAITLSPYQLEQSLVDAVTSTYHNLLTIRSGDIEDFIGSFSCIISNSRGSSVTQTLDIMGSCMSN